MHSQPKPYSEKAGVARVETGTARAKTKRNAEAWLATGTAGVVRSHSVAIVWRLWCPMATVATVARVANEPVGTLL